MKIQFQRKPQIQYWESDGEYIFVTYTQKDGQRVIATYHLKGLLDADAGIRSRQTKPFVANTNNKEFYRSEQCRQRRAKIEYWGRLEKIIHVRFNREIGGRVVGVYERAGWRQPPAKVLARIMGALRRPPILLAGNFRGAQRNTQSD